MSAPIVVQVIDRPRSGKCDFIVSHGKEGRERARVVLTTFGTYACMTCLTIDCVHASTAARHYAAHGTAQPVAADAPSAMEGAA